ncbi:MAG TPA: hydroxysqualene dehydroxylase HpnE [Eoetvoesiella sp.]
MKVAVIGGGWAGLSAALHMHRAGLQVTVFEAARTLGGRARSIYSPSLDATIDNGQHILLGAYTDTLELIKSLGLDVESMLYRTPLSLHSADGLFALRTPALPAPFHLLGAILGARGLSLTERVRLIALNHRLQKENWTTPPGWTVAQWLKNGRQSQHVVRQFWRPLCIAALNTPVEEACAQLLANVLRDSLGGPKTASAMLIPRVSLSGLWPEHLPAEITIRSGHAVRRLASHAAYVEVDNERYDAAVVATNAPSAHRLLKQLNNSASAAAQEIPVPKNITRSPDEKQQFLEMLAAFDYIPIATVTLALAEPWRLPYPMLMLTESPQRSQFGQWLFDLSLFMNGSGQLHRSEAQDSQIARQATFDQNERSMLTVVISDARALGELPRDRVVAGVITQIEEQTRQFPAMPKITGHELIVEKRATFAAVPNLQRPANATPWPRVWVAGDWTDTGYPAVLEGAIRSGKAAANQVLGTRIL